MAAAPMSFPRHPGCHRDTRPGWPRLLAPLCPEATLCSDTNHFLRGTRPDRLLVWDSRNYGQWWGKDTGCVSNGGTRK